MPIRNWQLRLQHVHGRLKADNYYMCWFSNLHVHFFTEWCPNIWPCMPNIHIPVWSFRNCQCCLFVQIYMAQSSQFHLGMCTFGSEILVPKVCKYIKSGHTFGHCTVNYWVRVDENHIPSSDSFKFCSVMLCIE
jgi:hypothetical protein